MRAATQIRVSGDCSTYAVGCQSNYLERYEMGVTMSWFNKADGTPQPDTEAFEREAYYMLTRMLQSGELLDNGIKFKTCSLFRHWRSEIDLDGLSIVPELSTPFRRQDFMRRKFLPLAKPVVSAIRRLLAKYSDSNTGL
jgi:hypothetical protein